MKFSLIHIYLPPTICQDTILNLYLVDFPRYKFPRYKFFNLGKYCMLYPTLEETQKPL